MIAAACGWASFDWVTVGSSRSDGKSTSSKLCPSSASGSTPAHCPDLMSPKRSFPQHKGTLLAESNPSLDVHSTLTQLVLHARDMKSPLVKLTRNGILTLCIMIVPAFYNSKSVRPFWALPDSM